MYLTKHELDNFISDCYIALVTEWFISWLVTCTYSIFSILPLDWCDVVGCIAMDGGAVNVVELWSTALQNNMPDRTQEGVCPSLTQFSNSRILNLPFSCPLDDIKVASCCWQDWVPWPQSNHSLLVSSLLNNQNGVGRNSWEHQEPVHQIENLCTYVHCL